MRDSRSKTGTLRTIKTMVCIIGVLALMSCQSHVPSSGSRKSHDPKTLTLATGFAIDNVDPMQNGFWGNEFGWSELLMRPVPGKNPKSWLLKSLDSVDDLTWKLTLHRGTHFQNGRPLDAKALTKVMRYQLKKKPSLKSLKDAQVKATGDRQVTLTTDKPTPNMPSVLADESMFAIYDQKAYAEAKKNSDDLIEAKLYTGPYVVKSLNNQKMTARADDNYWDGTPPLQKVAVKFIKEEDSRVLAVQKGEADLALYPPTKTAKSLSRRKDSYRLEGSPDGPTFQYHLNQNRTPLDQTAVRRALLNAVDYRELADDVMDGRYKVSHGMYSPKSSYAVKTQATDLKRAKRQLAKAGFHRDSRGRWTKNGHPLTLKVLTYPEQPDSKALAVAIQSQYKDFGITLKVQQVSDIDEKLSDPTGDWDLGVIGNGTTSMGGDPTKFLENYLSTDGPKNGNGVDDTHLDKLIDKVAVTSDNKDRRNRLREIQRVVDDKSYMGFLGRRKPAVVSGPDWKNYELPAANLWVDSHTGAKS